MKFPGIHSIKTDLIYRSLGGINSRERIGIGFMDKSGVSKDNIDLEFPYYVMVYVLNGTGEYVDYNGNRYSLKPGNFFQRFPGYRHSNYVDADSHWVECFMDIGQSMYQALVDMRIVKQHRPVGYIGLDMPLVHRFWQLHEILKQCDEDDLSEHLVSLLGILMSMFKKLRSFNEKDSDDSMLEIACRNFGSHFDREFDLEQFCRTQGWGYEKFRKLFRNKIGISPGQYRIRRRLDTGCQLLSDPDLSINEIAERLGYSSQYEFSAQFKKYMGISPSHYRSGIG